MHVQRLQCLVPVQPAVRQSVFVNCRRSRDKQCLPSFGAKSCTHNALYDLLRTNFLQALATAAAAMQLAHAHAAPRCAASRPSRRACMRQPAAVGRASMTLATHPRRVVRLLAAEVRRFPKTPGTLTHCASNSLRPVQQPPGRGGTLAPSSAEHSSTPSVPALARRRLIPPHPMRRMRLQPPQQRLKRPLHRQRGERHQRRPTCVHACDAGCHHHQQAAASHVQPPMHRHAAVVQCMQQRRR